MLQVSHYPCLHFGYPQTTTALLLHCCKEPYRNPSKADLYPKGLATTLSTPLFLISFTF